MLSLFPCRAYNKSLSGNFNLIFSPFLMSPKFIYFLFLLVNDFSDIFKGIIIYRPTTYFSQEIPAIIPISAAGLPSMT